MAIRILLAEDDNIIAGTVKAFLEDAGYHVDLCLDGDEACRMFFDQAFQLAIFDILLPGMNGHELLREFRRHSSAPVLMMSALSDEGSQIQAFDEQADDYITKPFPIRLLLKRVEALLRRSGALSKEITWEDLTLYPKEMRVVCQGQELPLTVKEFEILLLLTHNQGRTLTHEAILSRVWGYDFDGNGATVHTHIKNLRAKLPRNIIRTVRGVGYRIEEPHK